MFLGVRIVENLIVTEAISLFAESYLQREFPISKPHLPFVTIYKEV